MPLTYSQWIWGFEIFDAGSGSSQNNLLQFTRDQTSETATLLAGVYTADELAGEIARAMQAEDANEYDDGYVNGDAKRVFFDYSTLKFTIGGAASFTLNNYTGSQKALGPWGLIGFNRTDASPGDHTGASIVSDVAVGSTPHSTAKLWTMIEPLVLASPATAQPGGAPALLTQRAVKTLQQISDGATVESIYISTMKSVQAAFRALQQSEQTNMEAFLDWAVRGKRFTWQPDKTSTNFLKLVLANPAEINNQFEWLTRSETGYGTLTFYEQT